MKLKYHIKKYRSLLDLEFEIEFGKVNFIIGGNESGKSNILKSIHLMGIDTNLMYSKNKDETKLAPWFNVSANEKELKKNFEATNTSFKIIENNKKEMQITTGGETFWLINDSYYHNEIKTLLEKEKSFFAKLVLDENQYEILVNETIGEAKNKFIKLDKFKELFKIFKFKENIKDKIIQIYENAKIIQPKTFLVFPYEKASEINEIKYRVVDLKQSKSLIRAIFSSFSNSEIVEKLYSEIGTGEELDGNTLEERRILTNNINESIKKYFQKFKSIKVTPKLSIESEIIFLTIDQKDDFKYEIHTIDENERSFGFKYFSRILIEIKSLIQSNEHKRIIYMIDEPEQSLHPLLQKELLEELKILIKGNDNVSIVFATHSIYSFDMGENILFVQRSTNKENNKFLGETIVKKINAKTWDKLFVNDKDYESVNLKSLLFDKLKIEIVDNRFINEIKKKYGNIIDMDLSKFRNEFFETLSQQQNKEKEK